MAIEHILTDVDTLQSLAVQYLGDATRWKEIADYNKLDYPYIVADSDDLKNFFGSGYVNIFRADTGDTVVRKGWQFKTKPNVFVGGITKFFEVTEDTAIPAGATAWAVPCRCTVPGSFGNVMEYMINEPGDNTLAQSDIQFVAVFNDQKFTGGQDLNIRVTGNTIYIPTDSTETAPEDVTKMLELIGGTDIVLDVDGDLILESTGDISSVTGAENIKYAVSSRIMTELGDLTLHPEYGAEVQDIVGKPNLANTEKLITVSILRALSDEDRIKEPSVDSVVVQGTAVYVVVSYKMAVGDTTTSLQITM